MRDFVHHSFFLLSFLFFSTSANAQIQLGGGLTFANGDNLSRLGLNFRGTYEINEKLLAAPGISFFFKDKSLRDAAVS